MKKIITSIAVFALSACHLNHPSLPEYGAAVPSIGASLPEVQTAISKSLKQEGWKILQLQQQLIRASKTEEKQQVTVYVVYGFKGYDIEYDSSQNMGYDAKSNTISKKYLVWASSLNDRIQSNLSAMSNKFI